MTTRLPPELAVGFEEIDGQHRLLLRCVDRAAAAARTGTLGEIRDALTALGDELLGHFACEEALMAEAGYPDRAKHKAAHDLFMQDFAQLTQELQALGAAPPVLSWIDSRVPEWIRFHIQVNDVPLGRFLAARRARPDHAPAIAKPRVS
jgi:hemerythrin